MNYKIIAKIVKINKELNKIFKTDKIDKTEMFVGTIYFQLILLNF